MPHKLGPVRMRPPFSGVWHCMHFLKVSCPFSGLALGRRAMTLATSNGAGGSLVADGAISVIGRAQPGFSGLCSLLAISSIVLLPKITSSAESTAPIVLLTSKVSMGRRFPDCVGELRTKLADRRQ